MKRNKKYNPHKVTRMIAPEIIAKTGIYELPESRSEFISFNGINYDKQAMMKVYLGVKHAWTVALIVFKINEQGFKAIEVEHVQPIDPCLADSIAEAVQTQHHKLINKCPEKEFVCSGYIAIPRDEFLSSKVITDLFDKLGVWRRYITNKDIGGYKLKGE